MPAPRPVHTAESLVRRLKALVRKTGRDDIPEHEFVKATGIGRDRIHTVMGTYGDLRRAAGLKQARNARLNDDDVLRRLRDACLKAGRIPAAMHLERFGAHTKTTYYGRWRHWRGTLAALKEWVEKNDPDFPYLAQLSQKPPGPNQMPRPPGARYGEPLHPGPLLHAPTNEMGVVALFAGLATGLGFVIERVGTGFPDCEAKQRCAGGWRRVRIEFEFQSRNFERHRHDPARPDRVLGGQLAGGAGGGAGTEGGGCQTHPLSRCHPRESGDDDWVQRSGCRQFVATWLRRMVREHP
jgi:hypothetical protein